LIAIIYSYYQYVQVKLSQEIAILRDSHR